MKPISTKTTGSTYTAAEFEDRDTELENSVEKTGQTLNETKPTQLSRAMNINGIAAQSYQDSGTANAIVLTPITGSTGLQVPDAYAQFSGAIVEFNKTTANTSSSITVNIGQTTGTVLGAKNLKRLDGTSPSVGEVTGWMRIYFNAGANEWRILGTLGTSFLSQQITSNYNVPTPDTTNRFLNVDATSADVTITFQTVVLADISKKIIVYKAVDVANDVIISGVFDQDYILKFGEVIIVSTQEVTTGVYEWIVEKQDSQTKINLEQQDFNTSVLADPDAKLFEFSSSILSSNEDDLPVEVLNISHILSSDASAKFSDRGVLYCNEGYIRYCFALTSTGGYIKMRIKPNWTYTIANNATIIDNRPGTSTADQGMRFFYEDSDDKFTLIINATAGNGFTIKSDAFTSDISLQVWHDIILTWDKSGNDVDFYLNGVQQGGGVEGSKSQSGTGISALSFTSTCFYIGADHFTEILDLYAKMYFTDFLIGDVWDDSTTNYDGGTVKPNFNYNRVAYLNHNSLIDDNGNAGFRSVSANSANFGGGYLKEFVHPIGVWNMDSAETLVLNWNRPSDLFTSNIVSMFVMIRSDAGSYYPLNKFSNSADPALIAGGIEEISPTTIRLQRRTSGSFDGPGYDDTTINRGWIYIKYIV